MSSIFCGLKRGTIFVLFEGMFAFIRNRYNYINKFITVTEYRKMTDNLLLFKLYLVSSIHILEDPAFSIGQFSNPNNFFLDQVIVETVLKTSFSPLL